MAKFKYYKISNSKKIRYILKVNRDSQFIVFLHGFMSDLEGKKPNAFFLENVRHLKNHDQGRTFKTIYRTLQNLNYTFDYKVIKASDFGLPQHRPRIYMFGFYKPDFGENLGWQIPSEQSPTKSLLFRFQVIVSDIH